MTVVALDVGRSCIKGGVLDERGTLRHTARWSTRPERGQDAVVETVLNCADGLAERFGPRAVGLVVPGFVDECSGQALRAVNAGWRRMQLRPWPAEHLELPVAFGHDALAGALADARAGAACGSRDFLFVPVGTGISVAAVAGGRLLRGGHGGVGELGHVVVRPGGDARPCGGRGCLETVASGPAVARRYRSLCWSAAPMRTGPTPGGRLPWPERSSRVKMRSCRPCWSRARTPPQEAPRPSKRPSSSPATTCWRFSRQLHDAPQSSPSPSSQAAPALRSRTGSTGAGRSAQGDHATVPAALVLVAASGRAPGPTTVLGTRFHSETISHCVRTSTPSARSARAPPPSPAPYRGMTSTRNAGWMVRRYRRCRGPFAVATPSLPSRPSRDSHNGPAISKPGLRARAPVRSDVVTAWARGEEPLAWNRGRSCGRHRGGLRRSRPSCTAGVATVVVAK